MEVSTMLAEIEIFTRTGGEMLARWGHYLAGVTWVGLLYYFNFVQVPSFAGFDAGARTEAVSKLVPRALWWFRWGAVMTLLFGLSILYFIDAGAGDRAISSGEYWKSPSGVSISTGILLALVMFLNVWLVIWPNQKIVIANAQGNPIAGTDPAAAGRKGLLASRTNALFSIPMLFFMGATSHFVGQAGFITTESSDRATFYAITFVLVALFELNALGVLGGTGASPIRKYLESHRDTIIAGFVFAVLLYALFEVSF
jgi:hypothetical protein